MPTIIKPDTQSGRFSPLKSEKPTISASIKPDARSSRFSQLKAAISAIVKSGVWCGRFSQLTTAISAIVNPGTRTDRNRDPLVSSSPSELLRCISPNDKLYPVPHSSFSFHYGPGPKRGSPSIVPSGNGFAHTVIRAWQQELHLRLRPDDVWLAILTQFSFFVNGNADTLRSIFVAHEDRPELVLYAGDEDIHTVNLGAVARGLAAMVQECLKDPNVATILLPTFTTTTPHDRATTALALLGTMKEYFEYGVLLGCSYPSVTLLGERSDWADMLQRVAWFETIGHEETATWAVRLAKVLEYMVASFDHPDGSYVKQFWNRAVHEADSRMSGGIVSLSGWLTTFCWWDVDGKRVQNYSDEELSARRLDPEGPGGYRKLTLDGVEFPVIERAKVPKALVRVPITFYPPGEMPPKAEFLAGSMGMQVLKGKSAVQPASGWWLCQPST